MNSDTPLDYALFQLSPRRSHCELFVSSHGKTEKLASGLLKPFISHLKVAEEQFTRAVPSIKLEVERRKNVTTWFTKGTLERFVRFVSTPEVLELVNTFDVEMAQLEGARKIYLQGDEDPLSGAQGDDGSVTSTADITKRELLKAIDVRLMALKQDLTAGCARASAAGFTLESITELLLFADCFGAYRLNEACMKFVSLCQLRPELISHRQTPPPPPPPPKEPQQWKEDQDLQSSFSSSDMSIDDPDDIDTIDTSSNFRASKSMTGEAYQPPPLPASKTSTMTQTTTKQQSVDGGTKGVEKDSESLRLTQPAPLTGGTRRLSVQDRINLFESKQKEQSGVGTMVGGKSELRRLSSDVSLSMEKSVLRRWSGASDMSIDLNTSNNSLSGRKEVGSASSTPSSSFSSQVNATAGKSEKDTTAYQPQPVSEDGAHFLSSSSSSSYSSCSSSLQQSGFFAKDRDQTEVVGLSEQIALSIHPMSLSKKDVVDSVSLSRAGGTGLEDMVASQNQVKSSSDMVDNEKKNQAAVRMHARDNSDKGNAGLNRTSQERGALKVTRVTLLNKQNCVEYAKDEDAVSLVRGASGSASLINFKSSEGKNEVSKSNEKGLSNLRSQTKYFPEKLELAESKNNQLSMESRNKTFPGESEDRSKEMLSSLQVQSTSSLSKLRQEEYSGHTTSHRQEMKLSRQTTGPDQARKSQTKKVERKSQINPFPDVPESNEKDFEETSSIEHIHITKASKGKKDLNSELQMKAEELEKLFAAHKLRVLGDSAASTQKRKPADFQVDNFPKELEKDASEDPANCNPIRNHMGNVMEFDANMLMDMVDSHALSYSLTHKQGNFNPLGDNRGKFYDKYMQRREEKLREQSESKRVQKEAKLKAMQDSLENSRAEMKVKFARSADRLDSAVFALHRAEKLRSYSARAATRNKEQRLDFQKGEEIDDTCESFEEKALSESSSKNSHSKKPPSRKTVVPRTSSIEICKPANQFLTSSIANSGPGKRVQLLLGNPLTVSVSNLSELRKGSTKPLSGISKPANHTQNRRSTRSKSISEDMCLEKDDIPHRSESMRSSSSGAFELNDISTLNSDVSFLLQSKSSKVCNEPNHTWKHIKSKNFMAKGSDKGLVPAKLKTPVVAGSLRNEEDSEDSISQTQKSLKMISDDEDEFEMVTASDVSRIDGEMPLVADSIHYGDKESENSENLGSFSQGEDRSVLLSTTMSKINGSVMMSHESPGESPISWNSRNNPSFSCAQEASGIDASLDSPSASSPPWNSYPLDQVMESEAARMRKKWGDAQKPVFVAHTSHQSRKDVAKGFKRLLKFGRKGKGTDSLVTDWVSASTNSEGDDDTEDSLPPNRNSEDIRKSRMGLEQLNPAYDGLNNAEIFQDQDQSFGSSIASAPMSLKLREDRLSGSSLKAPRSLFSLSTFRSKGSESKLR